MSVEMNFFTRLFQKKKGAPPTVTGTSLKVPCRSDLWCRKRTSVSMMLDPDLFAIYMTGDDRIDEDWIIQSNPPCAFKSEFKEGCDTLLELLQVDPSLHATKGWLKFQAPEGATKQQLLGYEAKLLILVRTVERELKTGI